MRTYFGDASAISFTSERTGTSDARNAPHVERDGAHHAPMLLRPSDTWAGQADASMPPSSKESRAIRMQTHGRAQIFLLGSKSPVDARQTRQLKFR
jgi:hypothetical protein